MIKPGSKYWPLFNYLQRSGQAEITFTFNQIEDLLGERLPPLARRSRGWWSNRSRGSWQSPAWMDAGYKVAEFDLRKEFVVFRKSQQAYKVKRQDGAVVWDLHAVRVLRQHMKMTQAQFANQVGVRQQTVSEWEQGKYTPSSDMANKLNQIAEQSDFQYGDELENGE